MQIEKLLKKQVKVWDSKVMAIPYASMQYKEHLKQFIDGLIEREDGEIREFKVTGDGEYHFGENQKVIGWNMAKEYTISHLKEITKQLV